MTRCRHLSMICLAAFGFQFPAAAAGSWDDELPVIVDPTSQFVSRVVTGPDDAIHGLWLDWTDFENTQVMHTRSTDKGQSWSGPTAVFDGAAWENVAMHADAAGLHLLLTDFSEDDEFEYKLIYHTQSQDGGTTFSPLVRVGSQINIEITRMFSDSGKLYVWGENWFDNVSKYYFYVSEDDGATWDEKLMPLTGYVRTPAFDVHNGVIYMVFAGYLTNPEINLITSGDDGDTWSAPVDVSFGAGVHAQSPSIEIDSGGDIHVAWEDDRGPNYEVFYSRSTDGGATFNTDVQLNQTPYGARAQLLADDDGLHLVYCQYHGDDGWPGSWSTADFGVLWYRSSADGGQSWSDEFRLSQNESIPSIDLPTLGSNYVKLGRYASGFCAVWLDKRNGNVDMYMRNYNIETCAADFDAGGSVGPEDLAILLGAWGTNPGGPPDLNGDRTVDAADLALLLGGWGVCP